MVTGALEGEEGAAMVDAVGSHRKLVMFVAVEVAR